MSSKGALVSGPANDSAVSEIAHSGATGLSRRKIHHLVARPRVDIGVTLAEVKPLVPPRDPAAPWCQPRSEVIPFPRITRFYARWNLVPLYDSDFSNVRFVCSGAELKSCWRRRASAWFRSRTRRSSATRSSPRGAVDPLARYRSGRRLREAEHGARMEERSRRDGV